MWNLWQCIVAHELLFEVSVRVVLLLATGLMQLCVKPHVRYVSDWELLERLKRPRRHSIVSPWAIVTIVIVLPLVCFAFPLLSDSNEDLTQSFLAWSLALTLNAIATETLKLWTGRPRPDFFYRCFPDGKVAPLVSVIHTKDIWEGRKSFPSGHTSFSFCSMGFVSVWLSGKWRVFARRRISVGKLVVCVMPLMLALCVGVSRCYDNHHHWEDVFVGSIIGILAAFMSYSRYYQPLRSELAGDPFFVRCGHTHRVSSSRIVPRTSYE